MEELQIGKCYQIHGYKHNHQIYKSWDEAILLEIHDDYLIFGNDKTKVTELDGRTWRTKQPAILYFFRNHWYNIIGYYKKDKIYYYCNIASPFVVEEGAIKFIDYDLDLKVFPDGSFKVLDYGEYNYHKKIMKYPKKIDTILKYELSNLIENAKNKQMAFATDAVENYYQIYKNLKEKK